MAADAKDSGSDAINAPAAGLSHDAQIAAIVAEDRRLLREFSAALARGERLTDMSPAVITWWMNRY